MKEESRQVEFKFFDDFRVSHYLGSGVIKVERLKVWRHWITKERKSKWETLYFGHVDPLEKVVEFHKSNKRSND